MYDCFPFLLAGKFGYASIYGALPEFDAKRNQTELAPLLPSEKPWETIFCGSSHNLPPITKLCSAFLESLLEKRTPVISDWTTWWILLDRCRIPSHLSTDSLTYSGKNALDSWIYLLVKENQNSYQWNRKIYVRG